MKITTVNREKTSAMLRSLTRKIAKMKIQFRLVLISLLLGGGLALRSVEAFAKPDPNDNPLTPPKWCPLPTYKSSEGFITGVNAATREASGWGVIIGFAIVPLAGVLIVFFARDSGMGKKVMSKIKDVGIGLGIIVFGTILLTIVFGFIGLIIAAALSGQNIAC